MEVLTNGCETTPTWMPRFANDATASIRGDDLLAPLGCHHYHNRALDQWEITIFVSSTQVVGGAADGQLVASRFGVDIVALADIFDATPRVHWQAHHRGKDDDLGPHIAVEGHYKGHFVWLRIPSHPPGHFEAGRLAHCYELRLEDLW